MYAAAAAAVTISACRCCCCCLTPTGGSGSCCWWSAVAGSKNSWSGKAAGGGCAGGKRRKKKKPQQQTTQITEAKTCCFRALLLQLPAAAAGGVLSPLVGVTPHGLTHSSRITSPLARGASSFKKCCLLLSRPLLRALEAPLRKLDERLARPPRVHARRLRKRLNARNRFACVARRKRPRPHHPIARLHEPPRLVHVPCANRQCTLSRSARRRRHDTSTLARPTGGADRARQRRRMAPGARTLPLELPLYERPQRRELFRGVERGGRREARAQVVERGLPERLGAPSEVLRRSGAGVARAA